MSPIESWVVEPDTQTLSLSGGTWVQVRKQLNAGETFDLFDRVSAFTNGTSDVSKVPPAKLGMAMMLAYLINWNLVDRQGDPIPILRATLDEKEAAIRILKFDRVIEIMNAITAHDAAVRQEKKLQADATASSAISPSPAGAIGATNG